MDIIQQIRQADKYQTILFEDVRYSVPRHVAFEPVTVIATNWSWAELNIEATMAA